MKGFVTVLIAGLLFAGVALAADLVAVVTEIHVKSGEVHVRHTGEGAWQTVTPLQSLRPGAQVRVIGDGRAVLVVMGAPAPQTVTQSNSPFTVSPPPGPSSISARARAAVGAVTEFLLGHQQRRLVSLFVANSVRVSTQLVILAPRATKVLPSSLTFEWSGTDTSPYTVRVLGPAGLVWEQTGLARAPLTYPAGAPALIAGTGYIWEIESLSGLQRAQFEVIRHAEWTVVQEGLAALEGALKEGYPTATVTVLKASLLLKEGLYADARRELLAGIAASPEEPTLHALLAEIYDRTGLRNLASQEAEEAERLSKGP